jgi:DNA repair protein RadC
MTLEQKDRILFAEENPQKKLEIRGLSSLSDVEVLAAVIGGPTALKSAKAIFRKYLTLSAISRVPARDLAKIKGVRKDTAAKVAAAFEIGRRKESEEAEKAVRITESSTVASYLFPLISELDREVFYVLYLNRNNEILGKEEMFAGGVSATIIDPKYVFKKAIENLASAIVIAHNHPSGSLTPSQADMSITRQLKAAGELLNIQVLDHLIIGNRGYYSFADEGTL